MNYETPNHPLSEAAKAIPRFMAGVMIVGVLAGFVISEAIRKILAVLF
jgi:hypothetical protein